MGDLISKRSATERLIIAKILLESILEDMPTADPRKGKWINHRNDEGHNIADCDQCGEAMQWFDDDIKPNYCPNCGARMEEEHAGE